MTELILFWRPAWRILLLGLFMLAVLVWLIVRFWHLRPACLLAFSGLCMAGSALVGYATTLHAFDFNGQHYPFLNNFFSSLMSVFMLWFSLLVGLLALIRSTVGDRKKSSDTEAAAGSAQEEDNG